MKKLLSSIPSAVIMAALLILMLGCVKKYAAMQPIAQTFSVQTESKWIEVNPRFATVFDYLRSADLTSLEQGVYEIDGQDIYMTVSDSELRNKEDATLEVHDQYYDLQIPINTPESYGYRHRKECLQPNTPMDTEKDIQFFSDSMATIIEVQPMQFIVFSPDDAHAPMIGSGVVRKAVVKIRK